jgi:hypothetical protein
MDTIEFDNVRGELTTEDIIDSIRNLRNDLVKQFLNDELLHSFFHRNFRQELNQKETEFIKRDLTEMLISPVDVDHYQALINQMKNIGTLTHGVANSDLYIKDITRLLKRYAR